MIIKNDVLKYNYIKKNAVNYDFIILLGLNVLIFYNHMGLNVLIFIVVISDTVIHKYVLKRAYKKIYA